MYRWSWDNAQFDFGSAQAREVLQLGLTFWGVSHKGPGGLGLGSYGFKGCIGREPLI